MRAVLPVVPLVGQARFYGNGRRRLSFLVLSVLGSTSIGSDELMGRGFYCAPMVGGS